MIEVYVIMRKTLLIIAAILILCGFAAAVEIGKVDNEQGFSFDPLSAPLMDENAVANVTIVVNGKPVWNGIIPVTYDSQNGGYRGFLPRETYIWSIEGRTLIIEPIGGWEPSKYETT